MTSAMEASGIKQERDGEPEEGGEEAPTDPPRPPALPPHHARRTKGPSGIRSNDMTRLSETNNNSHSSNNNISNNTSTNNHNHHNNNNGSSNGSSSMSDVTRLPPGHSYSPPGPHHKPYTNGAHSPHSTVNGTPTPSPPALSSPPSLPPDPTHSRDSTQRQVSKVRRFLTTLHQFAADISVEVGERVRQLVLGLLSGSVSVEEFHGGLQEVTHFPLRPFVLPFLRSHLPLLQRDLQMHARRAAMTVSQYVVAHEGPLLEAAPGEPTDFFSSEATTGKRRHEGYFENGDIGGGGGGGGGSISPPPSKRPGPTTSLFSPPYPSVGLSPDPPAAPHPRTPGPPPDDEWKNIHVMLTCILSMVEKTRRALTMLQQREESGAGGGTGRGGTGPGRSEYDTEVRRHAAELVAQSIRATEERVSEVKRKAEEAVSEVRRAAVAEVQRAVGAAEARAQEVVAAERARVEVLLREVRCRDPPSPRTHPHQRCWNNFKE